MNVVKKHIVAFFGITMVVAQVQQPPDPRVIPNSTPTTIAQKQQEVAALQKQVDESASKNPQLKKLEDQKADIERMMNTVQREIDSAAAKNAVVRYQGNPGDKIPQDIQSIMQTVKTNQRKLSDYRTNLRTVQDSINKADPARPALLKRLQTSMQELKAMNLAQMMKSVSDRPL